MNVSVDTKRAQTLGLTNKMSSTSLGKDKSISPVKRGITKDRNISQTSQKLGSQEKVGSLKKGASLPQIVSRKRISHKISSNMAESDIKSVLSGQVMEEALEEESLDSSHNIRVNSSNPPKISQNQKGFTKLRSSLKFGRSMRASKTSNRVTSFAKIQVRDDQLARKDGSGVTVDDFLQDVLLIRSG